MEQCPFDFGELEKIAGKIPPQTCPAIDKAIKAVNAAEKCCSLAQKEDVAEDAHSLAYDAEYELGSVESDLEELRDQNSALREHMEFWKKQCEDVIASWPVPVEAASLRGE